MGKSKLRYTTLVLTVTVSNEDAESAKNVLMEALNSSEFPDAIYSTKECVASTKKAKQYSEYYE